jgi:hypothetical protein
MTRVTEKKKVKIVHGCHDNPVYLNWLGLSGGREYYLFEHRQQYNLTTSVKGTFEPYQNNIETAQGVTFDTGRGATPRLIIGAVVDLVTAEGIQGVLYSPNVLRLMNPDTWILDGPIWQIVRPVPGSFKMWDTDQTRVEIEFSIDLVEKFIQAT